MSIVVQGLRSDTPAFDAGLDLEDVSYLLRFRWNSAAEAWFVGIFDETGEVPIMGAVKIVANFPLFAHRTDRTPPGALVCVDSTGKKQDPGLADLGVRHSLLYFSMAELAL